MFLNLSSTCGFVEKFQPSFNLIEFSVKLSFSRIFGLNFQFSIDFVRVFSKIVFQQNSRIEFLSFI